MTGNIKWSLCTLDQLRESRSWAKSNGGFMFLCACMCNPGFIIPVSCCCGCLGATETRTPPPHCQPLWIMSSSATSSVYTSVRSFTEDRMDERHRFSGAHSRFIFHAEAGIWDRQQRENKCRAYCPGRFSQHDLLTRSMTGHRNKTSKYKHIFRVLPFAHACDTHTHFPPRADSVITFPFNPIDSIRLERCSNVSLASDHISCWSELCSLCKRATQTLKAVS